MEKILTFIQRTIACLFTAITCILVDIPLKIVLVVLFLVFGIIASIFYPLMKKVTLPNWVDNAYDYLTHRRLIAKKVFKLWL